MGSKVYNEFFDQCSVEFIGQFVMILVVNIPNDVVSVVRFINLLIYIKPAKLV